MFKRIIIASQTHTLVLACGLLATTSGCALDSTGVIGKEEALTQGLAPSFFQATWHQGDPDIPLASFADHWCALTGVGGRFRGYGEEVALWSSSSVPASNWILHGKSGTTGVRGTATCYTRSSFIGVGSASIVSPQFLAEGFGGNCDSWWLACGGKSQPSYTTAWQGDSITMMTGMTGNFSGPSEWVEIQQATTGTASTRIGAASDVDHDYTKISANSFFVGTPHAGRAVRFIDRGGWRGPASFVGETSAGGSIGTERVRLAKRDVAMCYLTHLDGSFGYASNSASIEADTDNDWTLVVTSTSDARVRARARCVLLDQRDPQTVSSLLPADSAQPSDTAELSVEPSAVSPASD